MTAKLRMGMAGLGVASTQILPHNRPVFHDGRWGEATLEVCLAIVESAKERKEIFLSCQLPSPE